VVKNADGSLTLELEDGRSQTVDCLIWAIGREPATDNFNPAAGVKTNDKGYIVVDKFQNTSVPGFTPWAITPGR
jgi:glutathione reductase (NADPH)